MSQRRDRSRERSRGVSKRATRNSPSKREDAWIGIRVSFALAPANRYLDRIDPRLQLGIDNIKLNSRRLTSRLAAANCILGGCVGYKSRPERTFLFLRDKKGPERAPGSSGAPGRPANEATRAPFIIQRRTRTTENRWRAIHTYAAARMRLRDSVNTDGFVK